MPDDLHLASRPCLSTVVGILAYTGAMCPKCNHGTRVTSRRWARCKNCGEKVRRRKLSKESEG